MKRINSYPKGLDTLQKISVSLMAFLVMLTFVGANLHALLWQQSAWLVSTVLPAVVVEMTNEERQQLNAPDLRRNSTLDEAARLKAEHMAENQYFSHYSPAGVSPWHWFNEAGYSYAHAGENLAIHFTDSSEVVEAWMDSPTHRANIVNANYTEIGVGTARGTYEGYDTVYVVQLFGTPAYVPASSVVPEVEVVSAEPEPVVESNSELEELIASANELSELVDSLAEESESEVVPVETIPTEEPEVLAQNTPVEESEVLVATQEAPVTAPTSETAEPEPEPVEEVVVTPEPSDVLVVESTISTSSGLAVASISEGPSNTAGGTAVSMITQPNELLQLVYLILGVIVMALLLFSAIFEARQLHFVQVSYSIGLMVSMGALWYVHDLLTKGAIIA